MFRNELEPNVIARILEEVRKESEMAEAENQKPPAIKKQYAIVLSDPEKTLPPKKDYVGWVLQIPAADSPMETVERLTRAAHDFNVTPKGRRAPIQSVAEICESVPARLLKEQSVWVKTKEPILILRTTNEIASDPLAEAQEI